jgi:hypothetical protein
MNQSQNADKIAKAVSNPVRINKIVRGFTGQTPLRSLTCHHAGLKKSSRQRCRMFSTAPFGVSARSKFGLQLLLNPLHEPARFTLSASTGERVAGGQVRCRMLLRFLKLVLPNPHHPPAHRVVASPLYAAKSAPPVGLASR